MPHSSLRPNQRLAPRCGQYWSITPTTPRESRNANSSSPITRIFFGGPSASGNSAESRTGSQKRRSNSPIGVPASLSVRNLLSSARSIFLPPGYWLAFDKLGAGGAGRQRGCLPGMTPTRHCQEHLRRSNDGKHTFAISRRLSPELWKKFPRPPIRGRREDRVRAAPAVSCAKLCKRKRTRAYRFSGDTPAFPAQWVTTYSVLPGERLFCHRRRRNCFRQLDTSTAMSGPHAFAVRL